MITTTLAEIRAHQPCAPGWRTLTTALGSDYGHTTPLPLSRIVDTNGIADALWALTHVCPNGKHLAVQFAADCAERVLPMWEGRHPDDGRPRKALEAARGGSASAYATNAAYSAAYAADAAYSAAYAADAAYSAAYAADAATYAADAAYSAAYAADAATYGAYSAAYAYAAAATAAATAEDAYAAADAAYAAAERAWQKCHLKELLDGVA
jgi:hypothetical protein